MKKYSLLFVLWLILLYAYQFNWVPGGYNLVRPLFLTDGGNECLQSLLAKRVVYRPLGSMGDRQCTVKNAVRIEHFPNTSLSSPITLSCDTANKLVDFIEEIGARSITHIGSYNCRTIRQTGFISEHGFGNAIDIVAIDGASVKKHWGSADEEGKILSRAHNSAKQYFSNVLTPDSNTAHKDHFHLDNGFGF